MPGQSALQKRTPAASTVHAVTGLTRDGSGRVTAFTEGGIAYTAITRNTAGYVTSYVANGVTHTVSRDGNNLITGVS